VRDRYALVADDLVDRSGEEDLELPRRTKTVLEVAEEANQH
jgi:hypothetical protein